MKKIIIIVVAVLAVLALLVFAVGYLLSKGREAGQEQARNDNPLFHTVEEGGACRDGEGDCQAGLTCTNGYCAKP